MLIRIKATNGQEKSRGEEEEENRVGCIHQQCVFLNSIPQNSETITYSHGNELYQQTYLYPGYRQILRLTNIFSF